jgi:hypothetical protein
MLLHLPGAATGIAASDLAQLLGCVLQQCNDDLLAVQLLQQLQEKGSLPGPRELVGQIGMCLQERSDACAAACMQILCTDPAARHVSVEGVQQLLLDAVDAQQPEALQALAQGLPAAAQLSSKQAGNFCMQLSMQL